MCNLFSGDIVLLSRPAEMADKILSTQTKGITGNAGGREESTKSATENSAIGESVFDRYIFFC